MTFSIIAECQYAEGRYAECHYATYMPLMLGVVMLIVVAPFVSLGRYGTDSSFAQVLMLFYNFGAD